MESKKGISLIVLVITIIVMIILAAAIIISLNNSGVINSANKAVDETNEQEMKTAMDLAYSEYIIANPKADFANNDTASAATEYISNSLTEKGFDTNKYKVKVDKKGSQLRKVSQFTITDDVWGTFTFDYEEGMTWEEFEGSTSYNTKKIIEVNQRYIIISMNYDKTEVYFDEWSKSTNSQAWGGCGISMFSDSNRQNKVKPGDIIQSIEYITDESL